MKTKKLLSLLFLASTQFAFGQITFQKVFQDIPDTSCKYCSPYVIPYDIKETYDDGYIVTGLIGSSSIVYPPYAFLMKLDGNGDTVWTKYTKLNVNGDTFLYSFSAASVLETCDSGYVNNFVISDSNNYFIKTDGNGNVLWSKSYPSIAAGKYISTIRTNDCGYILASATDSFGAGGYDIYVIKTDTGGTPLWSKTYGGTGDDELSDIKQTVDGGFIIAGSTNSFDTTGSKGYLIKTNSNGDTLWTKTYRPFGGFSVQQTYDKGYILLGEYLIKTDSIGNVMWSNTFSGGPIYQTPDTGYIFINGVPDVLLIKINSSGNFLWARDFPAPIFESFRNATSLIQTNDGGYAVADFTQLTLNVGAASYIDLNKTDANGHSGCNETDITVSASTVSIIASGTATVVTSPVTTVIPLSVNPGTASMSIYTACTNVGISEPRKTKPPIVYPNPVSPDGCISINLNDNLNGVELTIFNIMGEVLYSEVANGTGQTILLSLKGRLSTGMYFLRIKQGENICVQKIVVMG